MGIVSGQVVFKGRILPGVRITILAEDGTEVASESSDSYGRYFMDSIAAGTYQRRFYGRGVDETLWDTVVVPPDTVSAIDSISRAAIYRVLHGVDPVGTPPPFDESLTAEQGLVSLTDTYGRITALGDGSGRIPEAALEDFAVTPKKTSTSSLGMNIMPAMYSDFESSNLNGFIRAFLDAKNCTVEVNTSVVIQGARCLCIKPTTTSWELSFLTPGAIPPYPINLAKAVASAYHYILSLFALAATGTPSLSATVTYDDATTSTISLIDGATSELASYYKRMYGGFDLTSSGVTSCYLTLTGASLDHVYVDAIMLEPSDFIGKVHPSGYKSGGDFSNLAAAKVLRWDDGAGKVKDLAGNVYDDLGGGSPGGSGVPDARNMHGSAAISNATRTAVVTLTNGTDYAAWKLRGCQIYGDADCLVDIDVNSTVIYKYRVYAGDRKGELLLPNPEVISPSNAVVTLNVTRLTGATDSITFLGTLLGE
jgi:hypothetical protein